MESLGDDTGWEAVDKRSAQGLIASLPIGSGVGKKGGIFHDTYPKSAEDYGREPVGESVPCAGV